MVGVSEILVQGTTMGSSKQSLKIVQKICKNSVKFKGNELKYIIVQQNVKVKHFCTIFFFFTKCFFDAVCLKPNHWISSTHYRFSCLTGLCWFYYYSYHHHSHGYLSWLIVRKKFKLNHIFTAMSASNLASDS